MLAAEVAAIKGHIILIQRQAITTRKAAVVCAVHQRQALLNRRKFALRAVKPATTAQSKEIAMVRSLGHRLRKMIFYVVMDTRMFQKAIRLTIKSHCMQAVAIRQIICSYCQTHNIKQKQKLTIKNMGDSLKFISHVDLLKISLIHKELCHE